jgi:hypothetical protein
LHFTFCPSHYEVARGRAHDREFEAAEQAVPTPTARDPTLPPNTVEMKRILLIRWMNPAHGCSSWDERLALD